MAQVAAVAGIEVAAGTLVAGREAMAAAGIAAVVDIPAAEALASR